MEKELRVSDLRDVMQKLRKAEFDNGDWEELGRELGLHPNTLNGINRNERGNDGRSVTQCLTKWLERADQVDDDKFHGRPSFNSLCAALEAIGRDAIAERISAMFGGNSSEGKKPAKKPKTDSPTTKTGAGNKDGEAQVSGGDEDTDGTTLSQGKIEKWLKEGEVKLEITRINMHGAPGAGKTCTQHLLLNEPLPAPPDELTDSTPIACPAVKATRISIDGKNKKWEKVKQEDLLNQLASCLNEAPNETEHKKEAPMPASPVSVRSEHSSLEAELPEKKPIEEEPLEKKPTDMEVINDIVIALEAGKLKKLSTNWVYFIDSGGQPAYRELLPLFTRAAALNIITIDLTKGLDEKCEFQYRISQLEYPININQSYSNRDIIQSTVSSGAMFNPIEIPYLSESDKKKNIHPRYFVLGTRKDKLEENGTLDELEKMNKMLLEEYKANIKVIRNRQDHDNIIYPVNTMLKGPEREEASVALCTKISSFRVAMRICIPIRLFVFEISLQREAKQKGRSFLTKEEVKEIGKSLRLNEESDIEKALQYLHNVTIILYYPGILSNIIFVDPEPILDVLSLLIASTYTDHTETYDLRILGLFNEDLLQLFGKKIFEHADFTSSHMITLLLHLHIIAKVENREEGDYFFPCALPSHGELKAPPTEIQPLLITWKIKKRDETTLAIPQGLFPLTIVHLLEKKDDIRFSPVNEEYYRCNNAMSLRVFEEYHIDIINRYTHLEIRVRGHCRGICPQIRELVSEAVVDSCKDLRLKEDNKFVFAFKCPPRNTCIVKEDKCSTSCTHCEDQCKVLQGDDDSYKCWFSDHQSSSPGADETGMIRKKTQILDIKELTNVIQWLKEAGFYKTRWQELGDNLGLSDATLATIDANKRGDVCSCFRECLVKWLRRSDDVDKVGKPSLDTLAGALDKMDGCKAQAEYIRSLSKEDSLEGNKSAKSTMPKIDSTTTSGTRNKDGVEVPQASDAKESDGLTQGGSSQSKANKQQSPLCSFMCSGWVILPLCFAAVAVVLMIYLPSYLQMKDKQGEPTNHVHVHPEDVKPPQAPLPTIASKSLDISDLAEIVSKLKECKFDPSRWKDLCLDIGLNEMTISTIRSDEDTVNDRLRSCLVKWLNRVEDVDKKGGATWESLENGLINIGQKPVAEKLRERRKNRNK